MKRVLLILAFAVAASMSLFAQEDLELDALSENKWFLVGRFGESDDLTYKNRSVRVLELESRLDLAISYIEDTDGNINLKYIRIEGPDWAAFEEKMAFINEKFAKWTETAKAEGVTNFKKTIPVDFGEMPGKWSAGFSSRYVTTKLFARFEVDAEGNCTLRIDDWEEYDSSDSSYSSQMHEPFFVFRSPESFAVLYNLIKVENLNRNYEAMKAKLNAKNQAANDLDAKFD